MAKRETAPTFQIHSDKIGTPKALSWYDDPTLTDFEGKPIANFINQHLTTGVSGVSFGVFRDGKYVGALGLTKQKNVLADGSVTETGILLVTESGTKELQQLARSGLGGTALEFGPESSHKRTFWDLSTIERTLVMGAISIIVIGGTYIAIEGPKVLNEIFGK